MGSPESEDEWAAAAATWDEDPLVRAYAEAAFQTLLEACSRYDQALVGARVLDFGCGTGRLARAIAKIGATVVAFDTSPAMLEQLRARLTPEEAKSVVPVSELTPAHTEFDLVVASSALGFIPNLIGAVRGLAQRLKPGGLLVQWDWEAKPGEKHGLTARDISDAYTAAGLEFRSLERGFMVEAQGVEMAPFMGVARRPPER